MAFKLKCSREGCPRTRSKRFDHCSVLCRELHAEILYTEAWLRDQSATNGYDGPNGTAAWLAVVEACDRVSELYTARERIRQSQRSTGNRVFRYDLLAEDLESRA